MTTNTTSTASQAPAVSIHCQEFHELAMDYRSAGFASLETTQKNYERLITYIDAKLAQAREREWKDIWAIADAELEEMQDKINHYADRATAAEAKLDAIRHGIQTLLIEDDGDFVDRLRVSALLHPQPHADSASHQDCGTGTQSVRQLAASMIQLNEPECELAFVVNSRRINIYVKILRVLEQESDESGLTG